jgi:hypothetical protein
LRALDGLRGEAIEVAIVDDHYTVGGSATVDAWTLTEA